MLIKKELRGLPNPKPCRKTKSEKYIASASKHRFERCGDVLLVDIMNSHTGALALRYVSDGNTWLITDTWPEVNWKKNSVYAKLETYHISVSDEHEKLVKSFLDGADSARSWLGFVGILDVFSYEEHEKDRQRKWDRKYGKFDEQHKAIPDLPLGFSDWCKHSVFRDATVFTRRKKGGKSEAIYSCCGHSAEISVVPKSGEKTVCPHCGRSGVYSYANTAKSKEQVCVAFNVGGQIMLTWYRVTLQAGRETKVEWIDTDLYFFTLYAVEGGKGKIYSYEAKSIMGYGWDWYRQDISNYRPSYVFSDNLHEVFGERYYNVDLAAATENAGSIRFLGLLDNLKNVPMVEYMVKCRMVKLASELKADDFAAGNSFSEVLGIPTTYRKMMSRLNVSKAEWTLIKQDNDFEVVPENALTDLRELNVPEDTYTVIEKIIEYVPLSRLTPYLRKQKERSKENITYLLTRYRDYLAMSTDLKVDLSHKSVLLPKSIEEAHDRLKERMIIEQAEIAANNLHEIMDQLYAGMKEYSDGTFCIRFPTSYQEFVREGSSLNHCVGGSAYFERHIKGEKMIFFIREASKPDRPFFTMELTVLSMKITQLYGFGDKSAPQPVKEFARKFVSTLKRNPNVERKVS